jgi:hypothetical protein
MPAIPEASNESEESVFQQPSKSFMEMRRRQQSERDQQIANPNQLEDDSPIYYLTNYPGAPQN